MLNEPGTCLGNGLERECLSYASKVRRVSPATADPSRRRSRAGPRLPPAAACGRGGPSLGAHPGAHPERVVARFFSRWALSGPLLAAEIRAALPSQLEPSLNFRALYHGARGLCGRFDVCFEALLLFPDCTEWVMIFYILLNTTCALNVGSHCADKLLCLREHNMWSSLNI